MLDIGVRADQKDERGDCKRQADFVRPASTFLVLLEINLFFLRNGGVCTPPGVALSV